MSLNCQYNKILYSSGHWVCRRNVHIFKHCTSQSFWCDSNLWSSMWMSIYSTQGQHENAWRIWNPHRSDYEVLLNEHTFHLYCNSFAQGVHKHRLCKHVPAITQQKEAVFPRADPSSAVPRLLLRNAAIHTSRQQRVNTQQYKTPGFPRVKSRVYSRDGSQFSESSWLEARVISPVKRSSWSVTELWVVAEEESLSPCEALKCDRKILCVISGVSDLMRLL
jgi:hypothetical protein